MDLQILYPFTKDLLALPHVLTGLLLLHANIQMGIVNANKGPKRDPTMQIIHGPIMTEHQSKT